MHPFYSGLALSLLNPLHLPFWTAWTNVLKGKGLLTRNRSACLTYMSAIGAGTCLAFMIYGLAGAFLVNTLKTRQILIDWILGLTLLTTGLIQAFKLLGARPPATARPSAPASPPGHGKTTHPGTPICPGTLP
jgi:cytochrome c biogenesis protein CcdA